ncbi:carboxymuconolactone decarboxylase family protein [Novilysobacter arseniciresistens]|uniref:carboxymuconolactone decarboxylase family protein n=1 Tax=Novilysobacter arseniciresistens TaxID=1385522 RepID=UPI00193A343B|nr:carboxymuconolactone decarboxylase family protein [Lysobacter arseniciresistens]
MSSRVNLGKALPDLYQAVVGLDRSATNALNAAGIASGFAHLIALRVSQLNQCAFCVRLHARDALATGETTDRIAMLRLGENRATSLARSALHWIWARP